MRNKSIKLFNKRVREIILNNKGVEITPLNYVVDAKDNKLTIILREEQSVVYSVYMRFSKPLSTIGNPYSGKHNYHSIEPLDEAVEGFDWFFNIAIEHL